jgi:hypothetical protein
MSCPTHRIITWFRESRYIRVLIYSDWILALQVFEALTIWFGKVCLCDSHSIFNSVRCCIAYQYNSQFILLFIE